jgi:hypothetical protein
MMDYRQSSDPAMPRTPSARSVNVVGKSGSKPQPGEARTPQLPLPHERDESTRRQAHPAEPVIEQAGRDIASGQQDTDMRDHAAEVFDRRWGTRRKT